MDGSEVWWLFHLSLRKLNLKLGHAFLFPADGSWHSAKDKSSVLRTYCQLLHLLNRVFPKHTQQQQQQRQYVRLKVVHLKEEWCRRNNTQLLSSQFWQILAIMYFVGNLFLDQHVTCLAMQLLYLNVAFRQASSARVHDQLIYKWIHSRITQLGCRC